MQKTRRFFSKLTAAVLAGAMLVSGGAVSMTVSAASAKPVLNTDVTVPSAGNVLIGMEGTYANDIKAALDLVNQYRREACNNGYPNPENGKRLCPHAVVCRAGISGTHPCGGEFSDDCPRTHQRLSLFYHSDARRL